MSGKGCISARTGWERGRTALDRSVSMPGTDGMRFILGALLADLALGASASSGRPSTCAATTDSA